MESIESMMRGMSRGGKSLERVRHELLTALHVGKLAPGDRVPSVRRLAHRTGLNKKTIHRAYTHLAREGLLDLRPGRGTFITEEPIPAAELVAAVNRSRALAGGLGLEPRVFGAFLDVYLGEGLRGLPLAVVECNREQSGLIEEELVHSLGVEVRSLLLSELGGAPPGLFRQCAAIVTTDCHARETIAAVGPSGPPVYRVALDPTFPRRIADEARHGRVVMVVPDRRFGPPFISLLRRIATPTSLLERLHIEEPHEAVPLLYELDEPASVYVSPLLGPGCLRGLSAGVRLIKDRWRIDRVALERLKASLALDLAVRRHGEPSRSAASMR